MLTITHDITPEQIEGIKQYEIQRQETIKRVLAKEKAKKEEALQVRKDKKTIKKK